jgi:tRNA pseudouridine13 synthase
MAKRRGFPLRFDPVVHPRLWKYEDLTLPASDCAGRPSMKLKCKPEDFCVEELPRLASTAAGRFTFYKLTKRGIGTIEAVAAICRRWNLPGRSVSYGGLKDRHALTVQYLTIADGPARPISEKSFDLEPAGKLAQPYGPQHFTGNRFVLVLRDMNVADIDRASDEIPRLATDGLPNYFDDQRFGSLGFSGEFIAHAWLKGDHEQALKLALAEPNPFDRPGVKAQKAILRAHWGDWVTAKARLERSSERSTVTYLVDHPTDFRGAFARTKRELRSLYFSAFQSHLWNLILGGWIEQMVAADARVSLALKAGDLPFPRRLSPEQTQILRQTPIPLPSARNPMPAGPLEPVVHEVLGRFQLDWTNLRVKHLKDVFFSKGSRACLIFPEKLEFAVIDDDLHPKKRAVRLAFDLPRGSYATIMVKRITAAAGAPS